MPVDEDLRRKAVSAVLDGGMTQVAVCKQHGISKHHLRIWVREERDRRAKLTDVSTNGAQETTEERLRRLAGEWGEPELYATQIQSGLKAAEQTEFFYRYILCGPLWLVAGLLWVLLLFAMIVIAIDRFMSSGNLLQNLGFVAVVALVGGAVDACIWALLRYFVNLIFRSFAPFAYAVTQLQAALKQLQENRAGVFQNPQNSEEETSRRQITKKIGRAAHILDVTWRRGRPSLGSPISRGNERAARRKVAAYVAKAEELLWERGWMGRIQAIAILQIAAYETVLRKWTLHEFKDVTAADPSPFWRRRLIPFLKGIVSLGAAIAPLAWQVFGPEDQVPAHFIREFLHSRKW